MNDFMKWSLKTFCQLVLWVFILSIRWNGQTMFTHLNDVLVQNAIVEAADEQLGELWYKVSKTARMTFTEPSPEEDKAL